ncbi:hypothetical protein D3C76_420830 [compost metagenome]
MNEPTQSDICCAICGSKKSLPSGGQQFGSLQAKWGQGSKHDGECYLVHLCESCFFVALAYLRQERRIQPMFDDERPANESIFGRVACDVFTREAGEAVQLNTSEAGQSKRLGFMQGQVAIPEDFDQVGGSEIEQLFDGNE